MALSRLVEALLSAVWGQACVGKLRGGQVLGAGCWEGQAAGRDRLLGGTGCCGRTPNVLGTPCCLGTGCVCEMDRFWGQAAGRTPNVLGTGCFAVWGQAAGNWAAFRCDNISGDALLALARALLRSMWCGFPRRRWMGNCRARLDLRPVFPDTGCGEEYRLF